MSKVNLTDTFDSDSNWKIDESVSNSSVDGINILGRVAGPFFIVNGFSTNKRYYPKSLWDRVIEENRENLVNGTILGTIGHEQSVDDKAIRDGKISHVVTKLWIDESNKLGMGELLILNTDAGRNLNTLLRSGVKLPISSRAYGSFKGTKDGSNIVDPETYQFIGFDFVRNQGIEAAVPKLVENSSIKSKSKSEPEGYNMSIDKELFESITSDKNRLQSQLDDVISTNEEYRTELRVKDLEYDKVAKLVEGYENLGTVNELRELVNKSESIVNRLDEAELEISSLRSRLNDYKHLGSPEEVSEAIDRSENRINLVLNENKQYKEFGTLNEIQSLLNITEAYSNLGSIQEISEVFDVTETLVSRLVDDRRYKLAQTISEDYGVDSSTVCSLLDTMDESDARQVISELKNNTISSRYRTGNPEKSNHSSIKRIVPETRIDRLMESLS